MTGYNPYPGSYNPLPGISGTPMPPLTMPYPQSATPPYMQPWRPPASVYSPAVDSIHLRHRRMHKEKDLPWYGSFGKEVAKAALTVGASMAGFALGGVPGAMIAGAASAAALSALDQRWVRGNVIWGSVAIDGALGLLPGFVGKHVAVQGGRLLTKLTGKSLDVMKANPLKQAAIIGATDGAVLGYVGNAATCAYDTYQKTGRVEWQHALVEGAKGSVSGLVGGAVAGGGFTALGGRISKARGTTAEGGTHPKPDSSAGQAVAKPSESAANLDSTISTQHATNPAIMNPIQGESRVAPPKSAALIAPDGTQKAKVAEVIVPPATHKGVFEEKTLSQWLGHDLKDIQIRQGGTLTCYLLSSLDGIFNHPQGARLLEKIKVGRSADGYRVQFPGFEQPFDVSKAELAALGSHKVQSSHEMLPVIEQAYLKARATFYNKPHDIGTSQDALRKMFSNGRDGRVTDFEFSPLQTDTEFHVDRLQPEEVLPSLKAYLRRSPQSDNQIDVLTGILKKNGKIPDNIRIERLDPLETSPNIIQAHYYSVRLNESNANQVVLSNPYHNQTNKIILSTEDFLKYFRNFGSRIRLD